MDGFTEKILKTGLYAMIGKAERGPAAIEAIVRHKTSNMIAVGGATYLISKPIKAARLVAFEDLGMEAIYEFQVQDMPVFPAVDVEGNSVHNSGPLEWRSVWPQAVVGESSRVGPVTATWKYAQGPRT